MKQPDEFVNKPDGKLPEPSIYKLPDYLVNLDNISCKNIIVHPLPRNQFAKSLDNSTLYVHKDLAKTLLESASIALNHNLGIMVFGGLTTIETHERHRLKIATTPRLKFLSDFFPIAEESPYTRGMAVDVTLFFLDSIKLENGRETISLAEATFSYGTDIKDLASRFFLRHEDCVELPFLLNQAISNLGFEGKIEIDPKLPFSLRFKPEIFKNHPTISENDLEPSSKVTLKYTPVLEL